MCVCVCVLLLLLLLLPALFEGYLRYVRAWGGERGGGGGEDRERDTHTERDR